MVKHPLSFAAGAALGAVAMYYLDSRGGGQRRALVRDKFVSAGHDIADAARDKRKHAMDRARGVMSTGRLDRETSHEPGSDHQLHERVRAKLGHVIDHPKAIVVQVSDGCVYLRGHASRMEADRLVNELRQMAGVREVRSELQPEGADVAA